MNLFACRHLQRRRVQAVWIRALHPKYRANPLATAQTTTTTTRYNPGTFADPGFEILYLAEDNTVALFEVQALLGSAYPGGAFAPSPAGGAWMTLQVHVNLQAVVDLTRPSALRLIQTSVQELTGDWRGYALRNPHRQRGGTHGSDVPTQMLGRSLERVSDLEGFIAYSARIATHRNLMIFPRKLLPGSQLRCQDPTTGKWVAIP